MKKTLFIPALFFLVIIHACGLAQAKNDAPLLIRTSANSKINRLEIAAPCVKHTTKIVVSVVVRFDENFRDSIELNTPKEIYVLGFSYLDYEIAKGNTATNPDKIIFEDFDYSEADLLSSKEITPKQEIPQDRCIREICDAQFKIWLKKQPYSHMYDIERFYGHNAFTLAFPVILIPE